MKKTKLEAIKKAVVDVRLIDQWLAEHYREPQPFQNPRPTRPTARRSSPGAQNLLDRNPWRASSARMKPNPDMKLKPAAV